MSDRVASIHIERARHHNLKDISLDIPRDRLVVICGPSGSGKSTLAFDIVYAEGQRRYVESLSTYARQFLPQMDKPDVEKIEGLSPAISLEQQGSSRNPRSTVGTVTEIYDFLRIFFARLGRMHCTTCGRPIEARSVDEIIADVQGLPEGTKFMVLAPLVELQKGTQADRFKKLKAEGFARVRVNGTTYTLDDVPTLDKNKKHSVELVIDRLVSKEGIRSRLADSVELALRLGNGRMLLNLPDTEEDVTFSTSSTCPVCRKSFSPLTPQLFSFNGPQGACPRCVGLGTVDYFEPLLIAPQRGLSLHQGALLPWNTLNSLNPYEKPLEALGQRFGFTLATPLSAYSEDGLCALFYGEDENGRPAVGSEGLRRNWMGGSVALAARGDVQSRHFIDAKKVPTDPAVMVKRWPGVIALLEAGMTYGDSWREELLRYRQTRPCPDCQGTRLQPEPRAVKVDGISIADFCALSIERALGWLAERRFTGRQTPISEPLLKELNHRLGFLRNVGLEYLSLERTMTTLSGGEAQRIRLASQLGSGLVGVTYVLDEPSIGLHPRDNQRLLDTLRSLQGKGNTVLVVEHDDSTICAADHVIELGPGSGSLGGEIMFEGDVRSLLEKADTLTARYLRGDMTIPMPDARRKPKGALVLRNVTTNNLKGVDCRIPMGVLTCVTGVSGSGKSSLVVDTLYKHIALGLGLRVDQPGTLDSLELEGEARPIERIVDIDQSPIGRTPRSNPATYTKIFDEIRNLFAMTPDAKRRGYTSSRFSFNVRGGRCETCAGDGQIRVEMHFLPDVYVTCDVCKGRRYNLETLEVRYKGLNIAEVLDLTAHQARELFGNYPALERRLEVLEDVGLEYLRLGQPATTLSGGEAQRIKISRELGKRSLPDSLYILDEPTTGLHMHETGKLIKVLHALVERGASVVVIEHNTDVILAADHVIDMGPGGGENGGEIIACGTPEEIVANPASVTGRYLVSDRPERRRRGLRRQGD
ncbi:MAG: excinuclease ABC subunit UvrA [Desulfovibrio sp.]|jgi:excinuclease ABC subunit A|nr:excinuclease ABC subunit UvrA [Desulfovibrio sp.]